MTCGNLPEERVKLLSGKVHLEKHELGSVQVIIFRLNSKSIITT